MVLVVVLLSFFCCGDGGYDFGSGGGSGVGGGRAGKVMGCAWVSFSLQVNGALGKWKKGVGEGMCVCTCVRP